MITVLSTGGFCPPNTAKQRGTLHVTLGLMDKLLWELFHWGLFVLRVVPLIWGISFVRGIGI